MLFVSPILPTLNNILSAHPVWECLPKGNPPRGGVDFFPRCKFGYLNNVKVPSYPSLRVCLQEDGVTLALTFPLFSSRVTLPPCKPFTEKTCPFQSARISSRQTMNSLHTCTTHTMYHQAFQF